MSIEPILPGSTIGVLGSGQPLGPGNVGGRTRALMMHPTNGQVMWAASVEGGIWKTTDNGINWAPIYTGAGSLVIGLARMTRVNAQVLYASTNPEGAHGAGNFIIMKSTDNGANFNQIFNLGTVCSSGGGYGWIYTLERAPWGELFIGGETDTFYHSTDNGVTWSALPPISPAAGTRTSSRNSWNWFSGETISISIFLYSSPGASVGTRNSAGLSLPSRESAVRATTRMWSHSSTPEM